MPKEIIPQVLPRHREDAFTPEIVDPRIADVEALARWLDYAFELPGGFQFGLAGIIGLIPGIGDVVDAIVSLFIIARAIQLDIPRVAIARMLVNVAIEAIAGLSPSSETSSTSAFKANRRNYQLLKTHLTHPGRPKLQDWLFLLVTLALVLAGIALPIFGLSKLPTSTQQ